MAATSPFDWLNSINFKTSMDPMLMNEYNPFMVNRGLSYFSDTVMWANEMNQRHQLDKDLQYTFLLNTVSKKKRFSKWGKQSQDDTLDLIGEWYKVNRRRAQEIALILSEVQLTTIREKMYKGGK